MSLGGFGSFGWVWVSLNRVGWVWLGLAGIGMPEQWGIKLMQAIFAHLIANPLLITIASSHRFCRAPGLLVTGSERWIHLPGWFDWVWLGLAKFGSFWLGLVGFG